MRYIMQFFVVIILSGVLLNGLSMMESDPALFWTGFCLTFGSLFCLGAALAGMGVLNIKPYLSNNIRSDACSETANYFSKPV